jgi:rRNA processing/ribosome biogenesis
MESPHPLRSLLQLQLASDYSAVINLPYVLASVTAEDFFPSSHLSKWTTRINSLLYSKEAGGRWAGLCLAHKTAVLSKDTMMEFSQTWLSVALPILSVCTPHLIFIFFILIKPMLKET